MARYLETLSQRPRGPDDEQSPGRLQRALQHLRETHDRGRARVDEVLGRRETTLPERLRTLAEVGLDASPFGDLKAVAYDAPQAFRRGDTGLGVLALASALPGIPSLRNARGRGARAGDDQIAEEAERAVRTDITRRARRRAFADLERSAGPDAPQPPRIGGELQELQRILAENQSSKAPAGFRAYHGSPYDFDRFSMEHIGTGEGNQAFGHGLYFAESEDVARSYRVGKGRWKVEMPDGSEAELGGWAKEAISANVEAPDPLGNAERLIEQSIRLYGGMGRPTGALTKGLEEVRRLRSSGATVRGGRMYEVNVKADPDDFLDWETPLSQQTPQVKEALARLGIEADDAPGFIGLRRTALAADADFARASEQLREAGIPGIRYLDQMSRTPGQGTHNFVVFDDELVDIIRKYGWAGLLGTGALLRPPRDDGSRR